MKSKRLLRGFSKHLVCAILAGLVATAGFAQPGSSVSIGQSDYQPTPANMNSRRWFQDAKFGLFIHWGVYSVLGRGEWVMNNEKIPVSEYEKLPAQFNPTGFDAAAWVALA